MPMQVIELDLNGWSAKRFLPIWAKGKAIASTPTGGNIERAVREGLEQRPWDGLVEQVILGSQKFIDSLRCQWRGSERESRGLKRLRGLPEWEDAVKVVERLKGQKWKEFRDQHGDWGRDLALYLGRKRCWLKLKALGELAGGIDYVSVSGAVRRLEKRAEKEKFFRKLLNNAITQIDNK